MTLISARHIAFTGCFTDQTEPQTTSHSPAADDLTQDDPSERSRAGTSSENPTTVCGDKVPTVRGIGVYDTSTRPWTALQTVATPNPSWLVCHPGGQVLYAVNEVDRHEDQQTGALQVYGITVPASGRIVLTPLATRALAPGATGPTHVAVDPAGRFLVVSCYNGGQFNVFELDSDGMPGEVTHAERPVGHGLDPDRQEGPHAHHATCSPKGDYWLTCDLGRDQITLMRMDQGTLTTTDYASVAPGAGARHAVFHPTQPWIYVVTEMHATVVQWHYDRQTGKLARADGDSGNNDDTHEQDALLDEPLFDGDLFDGQLLNADPAGSEVALLPDGYTGEKSGAGIVMHPTGRWLYASTRRTRSDHAMADSVSAWAIDAQDGTLSLLARYSAGLSCPRAIAMSPEGDTLYALNQDGDSIIAMKVCPDAGTLSAFTVVASTPQPTCLAWLPGH